MKRNNLTLLSKQQGSPRGGTIDKAPEKRLWLGLNRTKLNAFLAREYEVDSSRLLLKL